MKDVDWSQSTIALGDICRVVRGSSPRPAGDPRFFDGDFLPWITVAELTRDETAFVKTTQSFLTKEGADHTRVFEPGTVLLSNSGATLGVPKITAIQAGANDGVAGFLDLSPEVFPLFLYYFLSSLTHHLRTQVASGVGQPNLNTELIAEIRLPLPPIPEQKAIAGVLSAWDQAIEQTTALIAAKQRLKQGLMQQLLTGQRRFPSHRRTERVSTQLHSVLRKVSRAVDVDPTATYREIGIRSHGKGIFHKDTVEGHVLGDKRVFEVVPGCLVLNIVFAWERAIAVTTENESGMIASHRFPMFQPDDHLVDIEYVLHYMLSDVGSNELELASPGGAGRNRTISQEQFLKTALPLPSLAEQKQIVSLIQCSSREITQLRMQLDLLKKQKRGLMQKLLTGDVRVSDKLLKEGAKS